MYNQHMKMGICTIWTVGCFALSAATMTIAPGNGMATNVSDRITGTLDVETNPGASGGGIVTLGRFNDYTGTTSNGCGTLVATALAPEGVRSSLGSSGALILGAGTFRYTGTPGATLGHCVTNAFTGGDTNRAVIVDAVSDFGFNGHWVQPTGAFIKKGPGTFTIHGAPDGATNYFGVASKDRIMGLSPTSALSFPANGDSPTTGYAGLTVAEGTLRIDGGVNVFGQRWGTRVGAKCDYGTATPTLELAGGTNIFYGAFHVDSATDGRAVLRISGGTNILNATYEDDRKIVRLGSSNGSLGVLEMTGGSLTIPSSGMNLTISAESGSSSSVNISGGTLTVNRYVILGYAASSKSSATLIGDFVVSDAGVLDVLEGVETYNVNAPMDWNFTVRDGGTVRTKRFFHGGGWTDYPKPQCTMLVDGGVIHGTSTQHIFGDGSGGSGISKDCVWVGAKGLTLQANPGVTLTISVPLVATNTVDGLAPAGLTLRPGTTGSVAFNFVTNNTYAGPTRIQANAGLRLSTGDLPAASEVICEAGSRLYLSNHARTFRTLDIGASCQIYVTPEAPLTVTDSFAAEAGTIYLKTGDSWSDDLSTTGIYTLLTVPVSDADALRRLAKTFSLASGISYRRWIETSATTATLKVQVYGSEDARVVDLGDGDVYDVAPYDFNLCRAEGMGLALNLSTGAVLRAHHLQALKVNDASVRVFFDGGAFQPVFAGENSYLRSVSEWIVGAGGAVFDLSASCDDPANATLYLNLKGVFRHDPDLGERPDGGLLATHGPVMLGGDFVCAFTGPVRVADGGRLTAVRDGEGTCVASNCRVEVAPGAAFENYNGYVVRTSDLTLGASGASSPTYLVVHTDSTGPSFAVTNALQVLSPIHVSVRKNDFPALTRTNPSESCTVLVFSSANSTVDPARFAINPADHPEYTATFTLEDYDDPDQPACDKALVMTCARKATPDPTWTATTGGGDWNSLPNWTGTDLPPNAESARAVFNPATAADVSVTIPTDGVTLRALTLDGAAGTGYALTGGSLALATYRTATPVLTATSGVHRVAVLQVADKLEIRTAENTDTSVSSVDVASLTGAGDVSANTSVSLGAGAVKLNTTGFTGTLTTGSGSTEVNDLSFATSADRLKTGASTFRYTGADTEFGGFQLNGGRATYFETDANLLARAPVATRSALIKVGTGTLTLGGTGSFAPTAGSGNNDNDRQMHANGDTPAGNYYGITVNEGTLAIGVAGDPSQAPTVAPTSSRAIALGTPQMSAKAGRACLQLNNGALSGDNITMSFYLNVSPVSGPITLRYEQNGGEATIWNYLRTGYNQGKKKARYEIEVNGGVLDLGAYVSLNYSDPSAANVVTNVFTVNGGVVNVGTYFEGNTAATKAAPTFVTLNGGRLTVANRFDFTKNAASPTVLDLNAGAVFEAGRVMQTKAGGTFNFNGGTFVPLGAADGTELKDLTAVNVSTNGAVIDTSKVAGGIFTIAQTLNHDARLGDELDGGLVKAGAGTLVLAAPNTFTGPTHVEDGVLKLAADGAIPAAVSVAYDGMLDLGGAERAVPVLVRAPGVVCNGTLALARGFEVAGDWEDEALCPFIDGNLTVASTAMIDLCLAETAEGPSSATVLPLACVAGTATVPNTIKAVRAGKVKRFALKMQSGMLLATPMSGSTLLVIR